MEIITQKCMKYIGTAAWGFRNLELEAQLALTAKLGFVTHELGIANSGTDIPADAGSETVDKVKAMYTKYGLTLQCAATGNDFTGDNWARQVEKVKTVILLCRNLGVKKLRIFSGFTPLADMTEKKWQVLVQCLAKIDGFAAENGVQLCLETHGAVKSVGAGVRHVRSSSTQIEDMNRLLAGTAIQIVYDPANLHAVGEDIGAFLDAFRDRIGYVHLKDFAPLVAGGLEPCALGEGSTPWEPLKDQLLALNVPMLMEYEKPEDLQRGLVASLNSWKGA